MEVKTRTLLQGIVFGLLTAFSYSISPVFVRYGMAEGFQAQTALTIGMISAFLSYFIYLALFNRRAFRVPIRSLGEKNALRWEMIAGVTIVVGTWFRYEAMAVESLAVVSALGRINLLVILVLARKEITWKVWVGGILIVAGSVLLSF